jgi:hypothetical protein
MAFPYIDLYIFQLVNDHPIWTNVAMYVLEKAADKFIFARPPLAQRNIRFVVKPAEYQVKGNDVSFIIQRKPLRIGKML